MLQSCGSRQKPTGNTTMGGGTIGRLPRFAVPMKGGATFSTTVVSPFSHDPPRADAERLTEAILRTFDSKPGSEMTLDVSIKKQNTARFLETCLKAREVDWRAPV
jgi:hypothetical protein